MEIVNCVGFNSRASSSSIDAVKNFIDGLMLKLPNGSQRHKNKLRRTAVLYEPAEEFSSQAQTKTKAEAERYFRSRKIHSADGGLNVKSVLQAAGGFCTWVQDNFQLAAVCAGIIAGSVAMFAGACSVYSYFQNSASPVVFQTDYEAELNHLNKLMNSFALEETSDYTSDGTLVDSEKAAVDMEKLFRQPVTFQSYKVQAGDTISGITKKFGLSNISTLIAVNDIDNVRKLCAGQKLRIPSMDGLYYTVQAGNSLQGLSTKYGVTVEDMLDVNELESSTLTAGQVLFIPGAKLDSSKLHQAMGELFKNPLNCKYRLTSRFGPRADPFTGARSCHTGIDMACSTGNPIVATASGKISYTGVSPVYGNYVIINHGNGYQSLYGHMSKIIAQKGQWVSQGTRIGLVGSTGYSTGPHLHFTVYKNGKLVDPLTLIK